MPRPKTRVTVEGVKELSERVHDPRMLQEPVQDLLVAASRIGQRAATDRVGGGLGRAVRSIGTRVEPTQARVFSAMPPARSRSIDRGRKPGQPVRSLLPQLIRWREAVGHPDAAIVIAQGIRRRGVEGRFFKRAGVEAVDNAMPDLTATMKRAVVRWWDVRRFLP